jgi:hypothetical protein
MHSADARRRERATVAAVALAQLSVEAIEHH